MDCTRGIRWNEDKTSIALALVLLSSFPVALNAQGDAYCPAYPNLKRPSFEAQPRNPKLPFKRQPKASPTAAINLPRVNFIDTYLLSLMEADGVPAAPISSDQEFLRRVTLDLTGRIPTPEDADAFFKSTQPDKRARWIDRLLASPAFVDHWTFYFAERAGLTITYHVPAVVLNSAYKVLRDWVAADLPLDEMATRMITAVGDPEVEPAVAFPLLAADVAGTVQDFWDNQTDRITTQWLGLKTECISCHNGRFYLNRINLELTDRTRQDFWRLSAFMSRTRPVMVPYEGNGGVNRFILVDRESGAYNGAVSPDFPGARPLRVVSDLKPAYIYSGATPASPNWRADLARLVTTDPQFAKAQINYLWARLFRSGIVEPVNAWDLNRVNPAIPLPEDWTTQNTHPELLDQLAESFTSSRFSLRAALRLMANSTMYQLSSAYPAGGWKPEYELYYARSMPRRLSAEELLDAVAVATDTLKPIFLTGISEPVYFAEQLRSPWEPASAPLIGQLLDWLGRGKRNDTNPRRNTPELLGMLAFLNSGELVSRTVPLAPGLTLNRVSRLAALDIPDEEVVRRLFLATLTRYPTSSELAIAISNRGTDRLRWLGDLQWALLQKLDFVFCL